MGDKFGDIAFAGPVKAVQTAMGSRGVYARRDDGPAMNDRLGPAEAGFIMARDAFYIATVSETGWPYIQFAAARPGFSACWAIESLASQISEAIGSTSRPATSPRTTACLCS